MKPPERIEKLIRDRRYKADTETYDKALGSFLQAVDEHIEHKSTRSEPNIWRRIMNSRIAKLAAAAVIVIGAYVVIQQSGGSIEITSVTFAEITENMKQMPWMHVVMEAAGERLEAWFSFERRVMASTMRASGVVRYQDDMKHTVELYDPNANTVTLSHGTPHDLAGMGGSAMDLPKIVMRQFEDAGETVVCQAVKYEGRNANIFKMSGLVGRVDMEVEMAVDAATNLVLYINQKAFDEAGKQTMEVDAHFDYPESGPESIYDLGVPASAKVVRAGNEKEMTVYDKAFAEAISVVDSRENWPEPRELVISYWQHRNVKNCDEMAILWPGSGTWNQSLAKEGPAEYVFGEEKSSEIEGQIIVPYASKSYYEKHGKYSLKMVLSNKKSAEKRYYIISGN